MKKPYKSFSKEELQSELKSLQSEYRSFVDKNLNLNMSRGKPCTDQLELSSGLNNLDNYVEDGIDCRNYGVLDGIPSCKKLFADLLGVDEKNIIIGPNESLTLMFDYISQCMSHGVLGEKPWSEQKGIKFLCPVPGYDRHFGLLEYFGIQMINIPMTPEGPDMDAVLEYIEDPSVKGLICVPKYSNPQGITFSAKTVDRLASMKPAARDFRIIWDNAYCVHDLYDEGDTLQNIFDLLSKYDNDDMVIEFCSTSKITFPGAGISALAASDANIKSIKNRLSYQTISYDKMNQLRHVKFFGSADGIKAHMKKHAAILRPKFEIVLDTLKRELDGLEIASWLSPRGGYFVSLDVLDGCGKRVGELCKGAGVTLTTVGATYPYGRDLNDKNIRIAPSFPPVDELKIASELLCLSVKIASVEKYLGILK